MKSPINRLDSRYDSAEQHLDAITRAIAEQFKVPESQIAELSKAVRAAYNVGRGTTTTDDWCNFF